MSTPTTFTSDRGGVRDVLRSSDRRHDMEAFDWHERSRRALKRAFDILVSAVGLVASSPLWLLFALAIKLDDGGPVFFLDERVGLGGQPFRVRKFRTMVVDAAHRRHEQASKDDPRVTRVGRFLRATALDELPQLWNILVGEMSFVGPRPLMPTEKEVNGDGKEIDLRELPGFHARHSIRPGLTGIAQVFASRDIPHRRKFRYDLLYSRRASLWLDVRLMSISFWITFRAGWENNGSDAQATAATTGGQPALVRRDVVGAPTTSPSSYAVGCRRRLPKDGPVSETSR